MNQTNRVQRKLYSLGPMVMLTLVHHNKVEANSYFETQLHQVKEVLRQRVGLSLIIKAEQISTSVYPNGRIEYRKNVYVMSPENKPLDYKKIRDVIGSFPQVYCRIVH